MATPDHSLPRRPVVKQPVVAFTVERSDGVSLMLRLLPGGGWRLREYDFDGDELDAL
jgi:hypothetical protein